MHTGYTIRRGEPQDVLCLPAIEREAAKLFEDYPALAGIPDDPTDDQEFREAHARGHLWIAFSPSDEPVGFALIEILDGQVHLEEVDVLPEHGRRGVGRALIDEVCRWANQAGHTAVTLTTFRDIPWNAPYYGSMGFAIVEQPNLTPGLRERVRDEASRGLDPALRVVMKRDLTNHAAR